jgi:hypothetical protein
MFEASEPLVLLDDLRIPYEVRPGLEQEPASEAGGSRLAGFAVLRSTSTGRSLSWPSADSAQAEASLVRVRLDGIPVFVRLAASQPLAAAAAAGGWQPVSAIEGADGTPAGSIWRRPDGDLVLPFDPNAAVAAFRMEAYQRIGAADGVRPRRLAVQAYYRVRPMLPRRLQLALRRAYAPFQARAAFPRWPSEPALHDLVRSLYGLLAEVAGEPPPWIAPWPAPHTWALVLTHDVETEAGYRNVPRLRAVEEAAGYRSSWNFVPRRYAVDDALVSDLTAAGFEVGVHGLYHDGRDLESREMLDRRLPEMRAWAERWGAVGFRSPATQRRWEWMDELGFAYDSSYTDTAPYEPQPGGCCSWLPFFIGDTVELPITIEQDHTVFVILRRPDDSIWTEKARLLRQRGGMALMITHPDYLLEQAFLDRYQRFLEGLAAHEGAWRALPREVAEWWRRRAASSIVRSGDGWRVQGPAEPEASVLTRPPD